VPRDPITREDVTSLVEARRELGEEMEPEVIDAFLDRVEAAAEQRAAQRRRPDPPAGTTAAASGSPWRSSRSAPESRSRRSPSRGAASRG
jgi:hypothetical protein